MAHNYSISEFGLKLIKAYEGFRPVETALVSGQRVIGYGHIFVPGDMAMLNKRQAEDLLETDLAPFEALVNTNVYAPLSQSQFDSLVSLSYNIGEEAFLNSSVLYHLNTGQPLAAAAGFDEWRKGVIGGKTYIVDALVRRRTAEKALFLRPATGIVAAPRHELPPVRVQDDMADDESMDVFENPATVGFVGQVPYSVDDGGDTNAGDDTSDEQASALQLHEHIPDDNTPLEERLIDESSANKDVAISGVLPVIHAPSPEDDANETLALVTDDLVVGDVVADEMVVEEAVSEDVIVNDLISENVDFETVTGISLAENTDLPDEQTEAGEVVEEGDQNETPSPIAVAAAQVSEQLDRLIDEEPGDDSNPVEVDLSGLNAAAQETVNEEVAKEDVAPELVVQDTIVQEETARDKTGQDSASMNLSEIDVPDNIDYNLQTPPQEEGEPEIADETASQQVEPALTLVDTVNAPEGDQSQQDISGQHSDQEPDLVTETSEQAQDVSNDVSDAPTGLSEPKQNIVIDEYGVVEELPASTPGSDIQATIDDDTAFAQKPVAPIAAVAALQNQSPSLVAEGASKSKAGFWIAPIIGLALLGGGMWKTKFASNTGTNFSANEWSAYIGPVSLLVGGLILFGGLYYLLKALMPRNLAR